MTGVIYNWQPYNKINGTLFYCFEYFAKLNDYTPTNFYIVDISNKDLSHIIKLFKDKYESLVVDRLVSRIIQVKTTEIYGLNLEKTLILDVKTFTRVRGFLTNKVVCFSNDTHQMFRYSDKREVKYFGSYAYQLYDTFCYLKLNFEIFQYIPKREGNKMFVSNLFGTSNIINPAIIKDRRLTKKEIIYKDSSAGKINLFREIDTIYLIHSGLDTNNRIIPEAYFYNKTIVIDDRLPDQKDSIVLRAEDIEANGLSNYTLDKNCPMILEMLC